MKSIPASQRNLNLPRPRLLIFYGLMALVFGYYLFRLFNYQIIQGEVFQAEANDNRTRVVNLQTQRGEIVDRNGNILARNIASYNVVVTPAELPGNPTYVIQSYRELYDAQLTGAEGAVEEIYRQISNIVDIPVTNPEAYDSEGFLKDDVVKVFKPCDNELGIQEIVLIQDTNAPYSPVRVKCNVSEDVAMLIRERAQDWPGVSIEVEPVRDYPTGYTTSEIIGFLGPIPAVLEEDLVAQGFVPNRDKVGYAGIEAWLDEELRGTNGVRTVEVDSAGQVLRDLTTPVDAVPGYNVTLTIDTRLQAAAKEALRSEMEGWNAYLNEEKYTNGVVIAVNPKTGEILAMVSEPTYENDRLTRGIPADYYLQLQSDPDRPLFNHAISAKHPPGSVFKMATAIGILNEGVVTPEDQIDDPGKITIEERYFENDPTPGTRDYVCYTYKTTGGGHGLMDFIHGVGMSCDVYFYKVGGGFGNEVPEGLNIWRIGEYARALGYGQVLGIELPGETAGLIPDPTWKRLNIGENWSTGDTYISTIGQGYVLSTPLQVLMSFATLANDGKLMKPTLIREITDSEGNVVQAFNPVQLWDITVDPKIHVYDKNFIQTEELKTVEPWVIQKAQEAMRWVVTNGTAKAVFEDVDAQMPTSGKTGTAEYCDNIAQLKDLCKPGLWPAHAWYTGYAPPDDAEIAVVAFVYNGTEGAILSAPVVRNVISAYYELKRIDAESGANTAGTP